MICEEDILIFIHTLLEESWNIPCSHCQKYHRMSNGQHARRIRKYYSSHCKMYHRTLHSHTVRKHHHIHASTDIRIMGISHAHTVNRGGIHELFYFLESTKKLLVNSTIDFKPKSTVKVIKDNLCALPGRGGPPPRPTAPSAPHSR